jgi:hypothetical protein
MNNIAPAFIKAKRAFGPALKDKTNPAFRSKYADLGACIDAVEDALLANGIAFIQETFEDATGVTVETVFLHESGEERRCGKLHVPAAKQDPQGYGSALTYARRYSLMAACGIAPEDDDGAAATKAVKRFTSSGTNGPVEVSDDRKTTIQLAASLAVNRFKKGEKFEAYDEISGITDNEEKLYLWQLLKAESAFRSFIKDRAAVLRSAEQQTEEVA